MDLNPFASELLLIECKPKNISKYRNKANKL